MAIIPDIKKFMFAGKAIFTIRSLKTGNYLTYKVERKEPDPVVDPPTGDEIPQEPVYFVRVLNGPDSHHNWLFLGTIFNHERFSPSKKTAVSNKALSMTVFRWFMKHMDSSQMEVLHMEKCGRCGRQLTTPESIQSGFGPECIKYVESSNEEDSAVESSTESEAGVRTLGTQEENNG